LLCFYEVQIDILFVMFLRSPDRYFVCYVFTKSRAIFCLLCFYEVQSYILFVMFLRSPELYFVCYVFTKSRSIFSEAECLKGALVKRNRKKCISKTISLTVSIYCMYSYVPFELFASLVISHDALLL